MAPELDESEWICGLRCLVRVDGVRKFEEVELDEDQRHVYLMKLGYRMCRN
jgi:hypothetical protein